MSALLVEGVPRPGPQIPRKGREQGAEEAKTAPEKEAPQGPAPQARLEDLEVETIRLMTEFLAVVESSNLNEVVDH